MNKTRRIAILLQLHAVGSHGLTMAQGKFNAQDVSDLAGLVERMAGPTGVYRLTEQGKKYLAMGESQ